MGNKERSLLLMLGMDLITKEQMEAALAGKPEAIKQCNAAQVKAVAMVKRGLGR